MHQAARKHYYTQGNATLEETPEMMRSAGCAGQEESLGQTGNVLPFERDDFIDRYAPLSTRIALLKHHSCESRNPVAIHKIPVFAGMTK